MSAYRLWKSLLQCIVCFGVGVCQGQSDAGLTNALQLATRARGATDNVQRIRLYDEAIEQCRRIAATSTNSCAVQTLWATCLVDLSQTIGAGSVALDYSRQARERLTQAERCAPQSWLVQLTWGRLLLFESERQESTSKATVRLLEEARQRFGKARQGATFKGDRANAEFHASLCLVRLAQQVKERQRKLALYAEASQLCESAANVPGFTKAGEVQGTWGMAAIQAGKLEGERRTIRQGVEHLQIALNLAPDDLHARYNLGCAYAILEQYDLAIKELTKCFENDPTGSYRRAAQRDEDLEALRLKQEFRDLFPNKTGATISD